MLQSVLLYIGLFLIIYVIYKWMRKNENYFEIRNIPYVKPYPLLGNSGKFLICGYSLLDFLQYMNSLLPDEKIIGLFDFRQPFYFLRDPEMLRKLMVKDFDHFQNHRPFVEPDVDELFGNSLLMLKDEKWRDMRATLSPAFTGSKMRQMYELVTECADSMREYYIKKAKSNDGILQLEMKEIFTRFTNDVIATCAFGIKIDSFENPNNSFYMAGNRFTNLSSVKSIARVLFLVLTPKLCKLLGIQFVDKESRILLRSMVLDTMKIRKVKNIIRPDLINILMQIREGSLSINKDEHENNQKTDGFSIVQESHVGKSDVKRQWSDTEMVAQCFLFFFAGFDTASTLLSFLIYEIALNKDIQNRLYKEICETENSLKVKKIPYDTLHKLKYLDMVVSETLRKWPPTPGTDRVCIKNYQYDDGENKPFIIEKGTLIAISMYGFHHDPKYFENPQQFDPERFNDENIKNIVPGTYLPFGIGPRNCIGSRFALMEIKTIIYYLMLSFEFEPYEKTEIPPKLGSSSMGIQTKNGIHIQFKLRK